MKFNFLYIFIFLIFSSMSFASWQNYKTEKVVLADGIILERKISTSSGKTISEEYKINIKGLYFDAQFKDGKWQLSPMGKDMYNKYLSDGEYQGSGGGC